MYIHKIQTLDKNWIILVLRWELNPLKTMWGFSAQPLAMSVAHGEILQVRRDDQSPKIETQQDPTIYLKQQVISSIYFGIIKHVCMYIYISCIYIYITKTRFSHDFPSQSHALSHCCKISHVHKHTRSCRSPSKLLNPLVGSQRSQLPLAYLGFSQRKLQALSGLAGNCAKFGHVWSNFHSNSSVRG